MTAERRLARLEGALSPKAATLLWLEEAHRFRSLPAYVDWLIDQPISAAPLERVPEQARAATIEAMRGQPREVVREAAHHAVRDAIFLVELVLRLNSMATKTIRIEVLRYAAMAWQLRAVGAEAQLDAAGDPARDRPGVAARSWAWRDAVGDLLTDLYVIEEARALLERRYLDGRAALFPETAIDWGRLQASVETLADLSGDLRNVMGTTRLGRARRRAAGSRSLDLDAMRATARAQAKVGAVYLVDMARAATLDLVGDSKGAAAIAEQRLRARCGVLAPHPRNSEFGANSAEARSGRCIMASPPLSERATLRFREAT